jgi:hypothetical protein
MILAAQFLLPINYDHIAQQRILRKKQHMQLSCLVPTEQKSPSVRVFVRRWLPSLSKNSAAGGTIVLAVGFSSTSS